MSRHDIIKFLKGRKLDFSLNIAKFPYFVNLPNLSGWQLNLSSDIYIYTGDLDLKIKRDQTCWKANILDYNFYEGTLPELYRI
jgi:hypothetical protein